MEEYHIFIRSDSYGKGNTQWFSFRMKNNQNFNGKVRILIANFTKSKSLFSKVSAYFVYKVMLLRACCQAFGLSNKIKALELSGIKVVKM